MTNTTMPSLRKGSICTNVREIPRAWDGNNAYSPAIDEIVRKTSEHFDRLRAPQVTGHVVKVLRRAHKARIMNLSATANDSVSIRMARQIAIHSLNPGAPMPNIGLDDVDLRIHAIQSRLKALDVVAREGAHEHIQLLNEPSIHPEDLFFAIEARKADTLTVHDEATTTAASTRMPRLFPVHSNWGEVKKGWAHAMFGVYLHYADWAGQTDAYRWMRDNAMFYLHEREFRRVADVFSRKRQALLNTNRAILCALHGISERLGLKVLYAYDHKTSAQAFSQISSDTVVAIIRSFKGAGGLLKKQMQRGVPCHALHDQAAFKIITDREEQAYKVAAYLYESGVRSAAAARGSRDVFVHYPTDYIGNPKPRTLYQALHVDTACSDNNLVSFEAIVCTLAMHKWADEGGASHDIYKKGGLKNGERKRFIQTTQMVSERASQTS